MIDIVRQQPDDGMRSVALDHFSMLSSDAMKWTPKGTINVLIAQPADSFAYFADEAMEAKALAPALGGGKPVEAEFKTVNDAVYLEISGEGAANVARALRDELHKNYAGSASIPEGRKK
jgi:hypothetical protein